jgi:hypothetical protein
MAGVELEAAASENRGGGFFVGRMDPREACWIRNPTAGQKFLGARLGHRLFFLLGPKTL